MRILVVGNADSIFIKTLIEKTMLKYGDDVSVLSLMNSKYSEFYRNNGISVIQEKSIDGRIGTLICGIQNIKTLSHRFDVVCFHFISHHSLMMMPIAKLFSKKVTASYWGSDILREKGPSLLTKTMLHFSDNITMISEEMLNRFHQFYRSVFDEKISILDFGLNNLEIIDGLTRIEQIYKRYNIDEDKIIISIGYNNKPEQQHIPVLEKICLLSDEIKNRIHIILRMTYGGSDASYISKVKELVTKTKCTSNVFESYMTDEEVAEITYITDIFIHAQTTDAQSSTMCEHLYANCLVLNPVWIKYRELEKKAFYLVYKDFNELLMVLQENITKKNSNIYKERLKHNKKVISDICSWEIYVPKWRKLYCEY